MMRIHSMKLIAAVVALGLPSLYLNAQPEDAPVDHVEEPMAEDNWINWFVEVDGNNASFMTNLKYGDLRHREGKALMVFGVSMSSGEEMKGFGSSEERERLMKIQKAFDTLPGAVSFEEASHTTCAGVREFSYVLDLEKLSRDEFSKLARQSFAPYEVEPRSYKWEYYDEWLHPRPQDIRWAGDKNVLRLLEEDGDLHHVPRKVDHWVGFETEGAGEAFIVKAKAEGFAIDSFEQSGGDDGEPERLWWVNFSHMTTVDINTIWGHTGRVTELADEFGGEYDGWGCFTITEEPEP